MSLRPRPRLVDVRQARSFTQADVAGAMGVGQENIAALERRDDPRLSTLIRYVQALGGELELVARFGEERVPIGYRRT